MDALKDFYKEAKNRVANPIFFSFILSWLLWNWKVPVGFIMYNNSTLKKLGYDNYIELVVHNASWSSYFYHPLISALIYTFIFPPVRVGIIAFLSWMNRINTWSKKRILKNSTVPMARFIKETDRTDALSKKLEDLYAKDSSIKEENEELRAEANTTQNQIAQYERKMKDMIKRTDEDSIHYNALKKELSAANEKIDRYAVQNNQKVIKGNWLLQISSLDKESKRYEPTKHYDVLFDQGKVFIVDDISSWEWGDVLSFNYNYFEKTVNITLLVEKAMKRSANNTSDKRVLYHQVLTVVSHINGHLNELSGTDSNGYNIVYRYRG